MTLDIHAVKAKAKELISASKSKIIPVSMLFMVITVVFGMLRTSVLSVNITDMDAQHYLQLVQQGNIDYAMQLLERMMPPETAYLINLMLSAVLTVVGAGFTIFCMNIARMREAVVGNLMDGFGMLLKILVLNILEGLFTFLWSLLLIAPGFVAFYSYRMAIYILIDDPSLSPMECIRRSKAMMKGHKGELFGLDLSFLLWMILNNMPVIGYAVRVLSMPLMGITRALYYDRLRAASMQPALEGE